MRPKARQISASGRPGNLLRTAEGPVGIGLEHVTLDPPEWDLILMVIDAGAAVAFWGLMVPWVPEPEARRRMSAVPLAGVPAMPGFYWAKGYTASSVLALFALVLISLIVAVWPFRRPMAKMMTEQETAGRNIRDRKPRDTPRGIALWLICVLVV
ncbi:hypothetical protein [Streptomyces cacaoi]|uniref:hypothetical protein n=1 Tax=Streptomyces cacaoi TaxID=1898 RepID=UPI002623F98A|nr:hypothetical protein [Streptomyces cacaoi]